MKKIFQAWLNGIKNITPERFVPTAELRRQQEILEAKIKVFSRNERRIFAQYRSLYSLDNDQTARGFVEHHRHNNARQQMADVLLKARALQHNAEDEWKRLEDIIHDRIVSEYKEYDLTIDENGNDEFDRMLDSIGHKDT